MISLISVMLAFFQLFVVSRFCALPIDRAGVDLTYVVESTNEPELVLGELSTWRAARRQANQVNAALNSRLIVVVYFDTENDVWFITAPQIPLTTGSAQPGVVIRRSDGAVLANWQW